MKLRDDRAVALCVAFVLAAFTAIQIDGATGVPAFLHDWVWPANRGQSLSFAFQGFWAWDPSGVGSAMFYPFPWMPNLIEGMAAWIAGPKLGLALATASYVALASAGMLLLARRCGGSMVPAVVAAVAYSASPVTFNEFHAGHMFFLFSMGLLPWVAAAAFDDSASGALVCGALLGLGSAQQQFLIFDLAIVIAMQLRWSRRFAGWITIVLIASAIVTMPQWTGLMASSGDSLAAYRPFLHWELAQSALPLEAARTMGYMARYADHLLSAPVQALLWLTPALALIGVLRTRNAMAVRSFFIALLGISFASGLNGPLQAPLSWMFSHVYAFAFFRELYDFSVLVIFGLTFALGMQRLPKNAASRAVAVALGGLVLIPPLAVANTLMVGVPTYSGRAELSSKAMYYRYLPIPGDFPVRKADEAGGGFSPFTLPLGIHPSAAAASATYPTSFAARLAPTTNPRRSVSLPRFGIGELLSTPFHSAFAETVEPSLRHAAPRILEPFVAFHAAAPRLAILEYSSGPGTLEAEYAGAKSLLPADSYPRLSVFASVLDPSHGWARLALWPTFDAWVYAEPLNVFTLRSNAMVSAPPGILIAGDAKGGLSAHGCHLLEQLSAHWRALSCSADPVLHGAPPLVVSQILPASFSFATTRTSGKKGWISEQLSSPIFVYGRMAGANHSVVVLRERFDVGWESLLPAKHIQIDGYANAWLLHADYSGPFLLWFKPGLFRLFAVFCSASLLAVACVLTRSARTFRRGASGS